MLEKLESINPWHFLWITVVLAEVLTAVMTTIQSYVFWGTLSPQILIVGAIDALFVPLLVAPIVIIFVSQISKLKQELQSQRETETKIRVLAYYDSLTNLPNRSLFKELLKRAIAYAYRHELTFAVLFIDLDNFKRVNDTLGHDMGDRLLQEVSKRVLKSIRMSDYVARMEEDELMEIASRLGGDEFVLLLQKLVHFRYAGKIASRVLEDISKPFELDGHEIFITASVGISLYPVDGNNVEELLKNADVAMYHAKSKGGNNYQYYSRSMNAMALEYLTLTNKLHKATGKKEFLLYYQPKQSLSDDRITGLEALIRWKPVEGDMVLPSQFIRILEETGLIIKVGEWVLRTACAQNKAWQEAGYEPVTVSVNMSNIQFEHKNLLEVVSKALGDSGLDPKYLELEITESAMMKDPKEAIAILHILKGMGIQISIDDFGVGYSSLNYLRRMPLSSLKIDRSFVTNLLASHSDAAIVEAIVALAHSLDLSVVAEGVETEQQLAFLRELGCDEIQGFLLGQPTRVEEVTRFLRRQESA